MGCNCGKRKITKTQPTKVTRQGQSSGQTTPNRINPSGRRIIRRVVK